MDISKYKATGSEIKTLGLKLQAMVDPDFEDDQGQRAEMLAKHVQKPSQMLVNPGIAVIGLLLVLIIGTFVLLHFW